MSRTEAYGEPFWAFSRSKKVSQRASLDKFDALRHALGHGWDKRRLPLIQYDRVGVAVNASHHGEARSP
jgi:hypothetical protein